MSPKATEGVAAREAPTFLLSQEAEPGQTDPLWPAGHLPLKGGDYKPQLLAESTSTGLSLYSAGNSCFRFATLGRSL